MAVLQELNQTALTNACLSSKVSFPVVWDLKGSSSGRTNGLDKKGQKASGVGVPKLAALLVRVTGSRTKELAWQEIKLQLSRWLDSRAEGCGSRREVRRWGTCTSCSQEC